MKCDSSVFLKRVRFPLAIPFFIWMGILFPFVANAQKFSSLSIREKGRLDPSLHYIIDKDRTALQGMTRVMSVNPQAPDPTVDILIRTQPEVTREELIQIGSKLNLRTQAGDVFTASMPISLLPQLATNEKIIFVSASYTAQFQNDIANSSDMDAGNYVGVAALSSGLDGYAGVYGQGVVVGVVDSGIDFRHPDFLTGDNKSRILYLWDQTGSVSHPSGYDYGTEWTKAQLDSQVSSLPCRTNIAACSSIPERDKTGHGTHVAGTAAGGHPTYTGMAPGADIIFIKTDMSLSHIIDGVNYVFQKAALLGKPAVVNLSLGTERSPHDGTDTWALTRFDPPLLIKIDPPAVQNINAVH